LLGAFVPAVMLLQCPRRLPAAVTEGRTMTDGKDLLDQFLELPADRREALVLRLLDHRPGEFPSVVRTPGVCGGSPRLIRTRIPVWLLQQLRSTGFTDARILECYPTLTAGDLAQAWGYVRSHEAEIAGEIRENEQY
jgi:uncharacterized protein (DUF433 family)